MTVIDAGQQWFAQWFAYLAACLDLPMTAPVCRPFWIWIVIATSGLAVSLALWLLWRIISYKLKWRAALRAQAERDKINYEEIERVKWVGDSAYQGDLSVEEIEKRISDAIAANKGQTPPNPATV